MIKPNLIASHDWHVQPICQRSLRVSPPERDPWDRGSNCDAGVSSNLMRCASFKLPAFLRELSKTIELAGACQAEIPISFMPSHAGLTGIFDDLTTSPTCPKHRGKRGSCAAQKSQTTTGKMPEPLGRAEADASGSCNGLFSLGIPYRGFRGGIERSQTPTYLTQRTSFQLPFFRAGP